MKLKTKIRETPEINVGSFADIAFLLIIFFILTTTFVKPAGDRLKIPSGTVDQSQKQDQQLTVNLKSSEILFGEKNRPVTLEQLRDLLLLEKLAEKPEEQRMVILDSAADVPYERYFQVVMAITNADGVLALVDHERKTSR